MILELFFIVLNFLPFLLQQVWNCIFRSSVNLVYWGL